MAITKEALQERIALLEAEEKQHLANANAAFGAKQDSIYWLAQLEQEPDQEGEKTDGSELRRIETGTAPKNV